MIVLGIETSCDETAASVVEAKNKKKKKNIYYQIFYILNLKNIKIMVVLYQKLLLENI